MATHAHEAHVAPTSHQGGSLSRMNIGQLGMTIFIGSEIMLFASFFTAFFIARSNAAAWPPLFHEGEAFELPKIITGVNTAILVFSSFTIWWAEKRLAAGDRKGLIRGLMVTIMLGATFLIIQINEYVHLGFSPQDQMFGTIFYCLTGLHGAHVFVGLTALTFSLNRAKVGEFSHGNAGPLVAASIYWHFVDVVWVFLYVVVYLV
jgi:cytochrome c oxidase subunit III